MKEEFLSFIWRHQYFDKTGLSTEQGDKLQVLDPGAVNGNAGPDFSQARISIDGTEWIGSVEIHVRSSDWYLHHHHLDPNYDQVILHVVWTNNKIVRNFRGVEIPTLTLDNRVARSLLINHQKLDYSSAKIPCEPLSAHIDKQILRKMMDKTFKERMERRTSNIMELIRKNSGDWDQVSYLLFGRNFGFHVNSTPFSMLVQSIPLAIVRKVASNIFQLEALFFGRAGLLGLTMNDSYYCRLQSEYQFLTNKYSLPSAILSGRLWKYLRLRPSNFPALRIAQFASFVHLKGYRFSQIRELRDVKYYFLNRLKPSSYWRSHYDFGKSGGSGGTLGKSSCHNLLINTAVPLLMAYAKFCSQPELHQQALQLISQLPPEHNGSLVYWKDTRIGLTSAVDTQALLELYNQYCLQKNCLNCEVGSSLLRSD